MVFPRATFLKIKTNISDLGLLRSWIITRRRLLTSTVIVSVLTLTCGLLSAMYILDSSTSVVLNLFLITLNMMVLIVASYLQAVMVGDLTFPGPWREQILLGLPTTSEVSVKNHGAEFTIILVLAMGANIAAIELGSGGFFDRYHNEGFFEVRLRSEDPNERLSAFEDLRDPMNYTLWTRPRIEELIEEHLVDIDDATAAGAIWLAGHLSLEHLRPKLILVTREGGPLAKQEALHSLGKLGTHEEARTRLEELAALDSELQISALRGLALMASPLSYDTAIGLVRSPQEEIRIHALWVVRSVGDARARVVIRSRLDAEVSDVERCALLDALKMVATEEDVTWARLKFNETPMNETCPPLIWEERNEKQHYVTYSDSIRVKYLKIVANADAKSHLDWLRRLVNDREEEDHVREVANEVLKRLKEL